MVSPGFRDFSASLVVHHARQMPVGLVRQPPLPQFTLSQKLPRGCFVREWDRRASVMRAHERGRNGAKHSISHRSLLSLTRIRRRSVKPCALQQAKPRSPSYFTGPAPLVVPDRPGRSASMRPASDNVSRLLFFFFFFFFFFPYQLTCLKESRPLHLLPRDSSPGRWPP